LKAAIMKMKVFQIIADSSLSGGPLHVFDLAKNLNKKKFAIAVICPSGPIVAKFQSLAGVKVYPVELPSAFDKKAILKIKEIISSAKNSLRAGGPLSEPELRSSGASAPEEAKIILHAHGTRAGILALKLTDLGVKLIYTEHLWTKDYHLKNMLREKLQLWLLKKVAQKAVKIVAVSKAVRDFLFLTNIAQLPKLQVIYNGVETPIAPTGRTKGKIIIGSVGSLNEHKGYEYLIAAVSQVRKDLPTLEVHIIGSGPLEKKLKSLNNKLKADVKFIGHVDDLAGQLSQFALYIQPSLSESFGRTVVQAMALGLPVITTRVGGLGEIVRDKVEGLLVPPKNPQQLSWAILILAKNKKMRQNMGKAAKKRAEFFSLAKMVNQTEQLYEKMV